MTERFWTLAVRFWLLAMSIAYHTRVFGSRPYLWAVGQAGYAQWRADGSPVRPIESDEPAPF